MSMCMHKSVCLEKEIVLLAYLLQLWCEVLQFVSSAILEHDLRSEHVSQPSTSMVGCRTSADGPACEYGQHMMYGHRAGRVDCHMLRH